MSHRTKQAPRRQKGDETEKKSNTNTNDRRGTYRSRESRMRSYAKSSTGSSRTYYAQSFQVLSLRKHRPITKIGNHTDLSVMIVGRPLVVIRVG